ncbi:MAG: CRISPR system precrRNA processing endoribonuclease RAMP protein Cas6, partial [Thermodesulfovibrionales bacterium]
MATSYLAQSLDDFTVRSLLLTMQAREDIHLGDIYIQGDRWRAAFGKTLRDITCLEKQSASNCNHCHKRGQCFFYLFFLIDIPHPYIIANDLTTTSTVMADKTFGLQVKLIGFASKDTDTVIHAFRRIGARGIGTNRGKYDLISAQILDIPIHEYFKLGNDTTSVVLQLDTPLKLKQGHGGLCYGSLSFETFFRLLLKRIINLNNIYGRGKDFDKHLIMAEKQTLTTKAKEIQSKEATQWIDLMRYSSRQSKRLKIGGIIGSIVFSGMLKDFYPYLKIGEVLHAGLHTTSGFGRYRII